jgi:UDP-glucose 4-epimerase
MRKPFSLRVTGCMDLQYVYDVGETFVRCLLSDVEGAHVFNLAGDVIQMDDFIQLLDTIRPGAAGLIKASGRPVPVAYRMDASRLHAHVPGIPKTPLEAGVAETLDIYERLHAEGRLDPSLPT